MMAEQDSPYWTDQDLLYDIDFDLWDIPQKIIRPDGKILHPVSVFNSKAEFSVHFCTNARLIYVVDLQRLNKQVVLDRKYVCYSPRRKLHGLVSARGLCVPCHIALEFGYRWQMPEFAAHALLDCRDKRQCGLTAERLFKDLAHTGLFAPVLTAPVIKASREDDYKHGVDFYVSGGLGVQVKEDRRGGEGASGNLFFQTHTLSAYDAESWYAFNRQEAHSLTGL